MKEQNERPVLKKLRMVAHEDVDVASFYVFVGPDDRMIAHFDGRVGRICAFVHAGQDVDVWPRRAAPGVPFLVFDDE